MKSPEYKTCGYEIETADDNIYKWLVRLRFEEGQVLWHLCTRSECCPDRRGLETI